MRHGERLHRSAAVSRHVQARVRARARHQRRHDVTLRYYIWQLGYGLFPWTGSRCCGLGSLLEFGSAKAARQRDLGVLVVVLG